MKKLIFGFFAFIFLSSSCTTTQNVTATPTKTQNSTATSAYEKCNIDNAKLAEQVHTNNSGENKTLAEWLKKLNAECKFDNATSQASLVDDKGFNIILFSQSCGGAAMQDPAQIYDGKNTVIYLDPHCKPSDIQYP